MAWWKAVGTRKDKKLRTMDEAEYNLRINARTATVRDLKRMLEDQCGVAADAQRLICRGRLMSDEARVSEYDVQEGTTLHLVLRRPMRRFGLRMLDGGAWAIRLIEMSLGSMH